MTADERARLRSRLPRFTDDDLDTLIAEARDEAWARARAELADTFTAEILSRVTDRLGAPPRASARAPEPTDADLGWYVYGVLAAGDAETAADDSEVVLVEGRLAAVTSRVDLGEFGEESLRERLADMSWVEATARHHEAVLEQLREHATVIPMRMCSVYRAADGVRAMLRREAEALTTALAHLAGKAEWGVKVFADPRAAETDTPDDAAPPRDPDSAGTAYMERKRRERDSSELAAARLGRYAEEIHHRLELVSADAAVTPLQRPEASGHPGGMILNGVYLVPDAGAVEFHAVVEELRAAFSDRGLSLLVSGPWPAYNFVPGTIGAAW